MTNKLLGIIAINLTIITGFLAMQAIPTATAQQTNAGRGFEPISGMLSVRLARNYHFSYAVQDVVVKHCTVEDDKKKISCELINQ